MVKKNIQIFLDYLTWERGFSPHTVKAYAYDLHRFTDFLHHYLGRRNFKISAVDKEAIRHFLGREYEEGYSAKTVARRLASLKSYFRFLVQSEELTQNPAALVKSPKVAKSLPHFVPERLIEKLMEAPDSSTEKGCRDYAMLEVFYSTGMRLTELVNLNIGSINPDQKVARVLGKGNKERIIPLGEQALESLQKYLSKRGLSFHHAHAQEPLFSGPGGRRISTSTVQKSVRFYIRQVADGNQVGPHILRHSFATHMLDHGADIRAVKDLLGHSSLSSTQVYTHIQPEKMKAVHKQAHPHGN